MSNLEILQIGALKGLDQPEGSSLQFQVVILRTHLQPDFSNTSIAQNDPKNNTQPSDEEMTHPVKHTACAS